MANANIPCDIKLMIAAQAAVFGSGCWAVNPNDDDDHLPGVACSSTGVGEQLIKALMAMSCAKAVRKKLSNAS